MLGLCVHMSGVPMEGILEYVWSVCTREWSAHGRQKSLGTGFVLTSVRL